MTGIAIEVRRARQVVVRVVRCIHLHARIAEYTPKGATAPVRRLVCDCGHSERVGA